MNAADRDRFRRWATDARPGLRQTAYLLSGDWYLADDLVQETLLRVYQAWARLSGSPNVGHYARRVLVNRFMDHQRRPSRRERPVADQIIVGVQTSHTAGEADGTADNLLQALNEVPSGQRAVLVLRYFDDFSVAQTASALGVKEGSVKSQTSRGLVALRRALAERGVHAAYDLEELG